MASFAFLKYMHNKKDLNIIINHRALRRNLMPEGGDCQTSTLTGLDHGPLALPLSDL